MKPIISIIVPVYNVESFLPKCLDSIISQTFQDIELILVDDGSPDKSPQICDYYKSKDERIRVIHKNNGGLSSARNAGLAISRGEYIGFVDSDDWIEPTMYEEMYRFMITNDCDMVECGINLIYENSIRNYKVSDNEIISGKEALLRHLDIHYKTDYTLPRTAVWSKLFKREFWLDKCFPEGKIHEDYLLTCQALYESSRVGLLHKGLLNHLTCNPNSIVNAKFSPRDLYKEEQMRLRISYLQSKNDNILEKKAIEDYYNYLPSVIWRCYKNGMKDEAKRFINLVKTERHNIDAVQLPLKRRLEYVLIFYMPYIYLLLRNFK